MADPLPALTLRACETMKIDLRSGVTTSRGMGNKGFLVKGNPLEDLGALKRVETVVSMGGIKHPADKLG